MQAYACFQQDTGIFNQRDSLLFPLSFEIIDQKVEHVSGGIVISSHNVFKTALFLEIII